MHIYSIYVEQYSPFEIKMFILYWRMHLNVNYLKLFESLNAIIHVRPHSNPRRCIFNSWNISENMFGSFVEQIKEAHRTHAAAFLINLVGGDGLGRKLCLRWCGGGGASSCQCLVASRRCSGLALLHIRERKEPVASTDQRGGEDDIVGAINNMPMMQVG